MLKNSLDPTNSLPTKHNRTVKLSLVNQKTLVVALSLLALTVPQVGWAQAPGRTLNTCPPGGSGRFQPEPAYTLGAGDRIGLDIFNVPEYSREYQVLVNGTVNLALIGSVSLQGLTLEQASNLISSRYARFLRRPIVTVNLVAPRPVQVAIAGEVNRSGSYVIPLTGAGAGGAGGAGFQLPTLSQALALAGGITQSANLRQVRLLRPGFGTINLNVLGLVTRGELCENITLRDGDSIFIPTATDINLTTAQDIATSNVAPTQNVPLNVLVAGEVIRPGPVIVQPDQTGALPTISRAIQVAGGVTQAADLSEVRLRRFTRGGREQIVEVNLNQVLQGGDRRQDLILQQGDTIVIPTAPQINADRSFNITNSTLAPAQNQPINIVVVGEVTRPGPYTVQPTQTGSPPTLSRALQAAGGINQTADITQVQLRRITRNGNIQTTTINLQELLQGGDRRQDIFLQEGDSIVVPTATAPLPAATSLEIISSSIAADPSQPLNVAVVGEVQRPGTYLIQPFRPAQGVQGALPSFAGLPTLSQAIQQAGGITQMADIRRIEIRRNTRLGTQQILVSNFWQLLQSGDRSQDLILQQGDTIFVPTAQDVNPSEAPQIASSSLSPATIRVNVVGEVIRPGILQVPPNTSLNQAVLAAGGFSPTRARTSFVQLLRLNPNGTVTKRNVSINFSRGINEDGNPILRDNDVIVVNRSFAAEVTDGLRIWLDPISNFFSIFNLIRIFESL
ncbi:polysaccharide biosynthesis/export family protein [Aerosakkonemataceae cyanobacterium BLCC-F154]|uniref:Polysaccharide biosynthesis/export family protein n=1 Tax=Floridaenema fluviatile BLCC-F154 TaxID=3153640 RepID=A0ABV4Y5Z2_9CYAN